MIGVSVNLKEDFHWIINYKINLHKGDNTCTNLMRLQISY